MKKNVYTYTMHPEVREEKPAAGILYPRYGITLRFEFSALLMSISSIIVATNAVLLKRAEKDLLEFYLKGSE